MVADVAEKYEILGEVGSGGFSRVYKARHREMGREVAIKVLDGAAAATTAADEVEKRFAREARLVSRLRHPNTITIYDFGVDAGGRWHLVMEYVEGKTLHHVIATEGPLDPRRVASIAVGILGSLAEAHHAGILHRDMKPGNVMLTKDFAGDEVAKVLDFGVATLHGATSLVGEVKALKATQLGHFVGTPTYASPEQFLGQRLTPASDLYAVGLVMWEMLLGRPAVESDAFGAALTQHVSPDVWRVPKGAQIPERLASIVERALQKDPGRRHASAIEMKDALEAWLRGAELRDPPPTERTDWTPALDYASGAFDVRALSDDELTIIDPNLDPDAVPEFLRSPVREPQTQRRAATDPPAKPRVVQREERLEIDYERAGMRPSRRDATRNVERDVGRTRRVQRARRPSWNPRFGMAAAAVVVVGAITYSLWPASEDDPALTADELIENEAMFVDLEADEVEDVPPAHQFTSAGIVEAVRRNGWSIRKQSDDHALANVHQQRYRAIRGDAELELELVTTKSSAIAAEMAADTRPPVRVVAFDNKLVRIFPPVRGDSRSGTELERWLTKYREMVLDPGTDDADGGRAR